MKNNSFKLFLFLAVLYSFSINNSYSATIKDIPDDFFKALAQIESNNNPKAIGDNGLAIGIYQIHKNYFLDAQKYDKNLNKYKYSDCFNPEISKLVVKAYMSRYCKNGSYDEMARCHNSGWNYKKKYELTNKYAARFNKALNSLTNR